MEMHFDKGRQWNWFPTHTPAATRRVCIVTNCVTFFSPFPFPLLLPLHVRNSLRLLGGILHFFRTPAASHCLEINFSTKYSLLFPSLSHSLCGYFCCVLSFMLLRIFMVSLMFIFSAAAYMSWVFPRFLYASRHVRGLLDHGNWS